MLISSVATVKLTVITVIKVLSLTFISTMIFRDFTKLLANPKLLDKTKKKNVFKFTKMRFDLCVGL